MGKLDESVYGPKGDGFILIFHGAGLSSRQRQNMLKPAEDLKRSSNSAAGGKMGSKDFIETASKCFLIATSVGVRIRSG